MSEEKALSGSELERLSVAAWLASNPGRTEDGWKRADREFRYVFIMISGAVAEALGYTITQEELSKIV
jgi:hypothetical protein